MTQEATRVNYSLRNINGIELVLPPMCRDDLNNLTRPDIFDISSTQKYPLGTLAEFGDGRKFRYAKAGAALANVARAVINSNYIPGGTGHEDEDAHTTHTRLQHLKPLLGGLTATGCIKDVVDPPTISSSVYFLNGIRVKWVNYNVST